jgi:ubiquinone/menaquinone biosynthesis C-methylase UbiE
VEFRLGEIENLPVADGTVGVVISSCAINLSRDKKRVFEEAFRVLKHCGKLIVSGIILLERFPQDVMGSVQTHTGCIAGAETKDKYVKLIKNPGFQKTTSAEEKHFATGNLASDRIVQDIMNALEVSAHRVGSILTV